MRQRKKMVSALLLFAMLITAISSSYGNYTEAGAASKTKVTLQLNKSSVTLNLGGKKNLKLKTKNVQKVKKTSWSVQNKKIAKVTKKGVVTAVKVGNTTVKCAVKYLPKGKKKYQTKTLKCKIVVKAPASASTEEAEPTPIQTDGTAATTTQTPAPGTVQTPAGDSNGTDPSDTATVPNASPSVTHSVPEESGEPAGATGVPSESEVSTSPVSTVPPSATTEPSPATTGLPSTATPLPTADIQQAEEHLSANGIKTIDNGQMRSNMTAFDIQHEMGLGINLGNTMESCGTWINSSSVSNYERAWGAPITTQEMITGMKEAGFHSIRIPVSWSNMMSTDGKYTIHEDYFNRVETIMNYAFNEGMYVIVNIHFDGGWWARFGSTVESERSEAMEKYKTMWTQIANRYKEYSDHLIFESANEELGERLNSTDDYTDSGYFTSEDELYKMTNEINQTFVDIVRGTGGNNSTRHLLIAGYNTDISKTCDSRYHMPDDTVENHLMVSIHYYSPSTYCLVEAEDNDWGYADSWGTDEEVAAMKAELSNMKLSFVNKGIPVIIGEYGGACNTKLSDGTYQRKDGRDKFFQTLCEYALNNGMCPVLWDIHFDNPTDGIYNRSTCEMVDDTEADNFLALSEMAENLPVFEPSVGKDTLVWNGTIGCDNWNPTNPVAGDDCDFVMTSVGGCYKISGVDWSQFSSPVLTLHSVSLTGTIPYKIATEEHVNTSNQYYFYLEDSAQISGDWLTTSDDLVKDLSDLQLTDGESIYINMVNNGFDGEVTITVSEKTS